MCMECDVYMEVQITICTRYVIALVVTTAVLCTGINQLLGQKFCVQPCTFNKCHTVVKASIDYGLASEQYYAMLAGVMSVNGGVGCCNQSKQLIRSA